MLNSFAAQWQRTICETGCVPAVTADLVAANFLPVDFGAADFFAVTSCAPVRLPRLPFRAANPGEPVRLHPRSCLWAGADWRPNISRVLHDTRRCFRACPRGSC